MAFVNDEVVELLRGTQPRTSRRLPELLADFRVAAWMKGAGERSKASGRVSGSCARSFSASSGSELASRGQEVDSTPPAVLSLEAVGYYEVIVKRRRMSVGLAWNTPKSARGPWRLSQSPALTIELNANYFRRLGLPSLVNG
jgi:hypothetical protein